VMGFHHPANFGLPKSRAWQINIVVDGYVVLRKRRNGYFVNCSISEIHRAVYM